MLPVPCNLRPTCSFNRTGQSIQKLIRMPAGRALSHWNKKPRLDTLAVVPYPVIPSGPGKVYPSRGSDAIPEIAACKKADVFMKLGEGGSAAPTPPALDNAGGSAWRPMSRGRHRSGDDPGCTQRSSLRAIANRV